MKKILILLFVIFASTPAQSKENGITLVEKWNCGDANLSAAFYSTNIKENKQYGNNNLFITIDNKRIIEFQLESDWIYSMECVTGKGDYAILHRYMPGNISDTLFSVVNLTNGITEVEFPDDIRDGDSSKGVMKVTGVTASNTRCVDVNNNIIGSKRICFAAPDLAKVYKRSQVNQ